MSAKGNRFHLVRGGLLKRRAMLMACGAVCNAAMLSFMAPGAQAASYTWTSSSSGNWSDGTKWMGGSPAVVDSSGDASLEFNAPGTYTANNDLGTFQLYNTTFDAGNGSTTLSGGDLGLNYPLSENNLPAVSDFSTNPVTINNNVTFEAPSGVGPTPEYFVLAPGSTMTFNGAMNLSGGSSIKMTNGEQSPGDATHLGGAGGTMIWTQPVNFTNNPPGAYGGYFAFRIYEGTFEMGGYTISDGTSDQPIYTVDGTNLHQTNANPPLNNGVQTDVYIGPEDLENGHPNDVVAFYLMSAGQSFNTRIQIGDAGTTTIGGLNTSGTVYLNDFILTLPTDGNGIYNNAPAGIPFANAGKSQTVYFSAATGGTVMQNFAFVRGGGSGFNGASVDKVGGGTWIVTAGGTSPTGEQAYHGTTTVRDGTLELAYDDTGINNVTLSPAVLADPNGAFYASGADGGSLGFNDPNLVVNNVQVNNVQLGDSGTLPTDNIALLTAVLTGVGGLGPRQVLHNINVNNFNPNGTTSIGVADNSIGNFKGNVTLARSVVLASGTGGTANFLGNITGTGAITANGTGTVNLSAVNSYNGATNVTAGATLVIATAGAMPSGSAIVNNGTTNINANSVSGNVSGTGTLNVGIASPAVLKINVGTGASSQNALNVGANSTLDITNNHLFVNYGSGPDPIASIKSLITSGYAGGSWTGKGITSTQAQANATLYGIGYADSADAGNPAGLASGQIEIKYTLLGDANLDSKVNGTDFAILATNFNQAVNSWDAGDFNYDNKANGSDFAFIATNFNQGASQADTASLDAFAAANGLLADVPEPGSLGLFILAGASFLHRRRSSRTKR